MALPAGRYGLTRKLFERILNSTFSGITSDDVGDGLTISNNKAVVNAGDGISFDANGKLKNNIGGGLTTSDGKTVINVGDGLTVDSNGKLKATGVDTKGVVSVKTTTYEGDGSSSTNSFYLPVDENEVVLCVIGIDDVYEQSSHYNHINSFYPISWVETGYTGAVALTSQSSAYKTYSGRAAMSGPFNDGYLVQFSAGASADELCNEDDHIYKVVYLTYKVSSAT